MQTFSWSHSHLGTRASRPHPPTCGHSFPSFGSHLQRRRGDSTVGTAAAVQSPFIWESSSTSLVLDSLVLDSAQCSLPSFGSHLQRGGRRKNSGTGCSLPSFGSHLQRAPFARPSPRRCSLPSFGSHLQLARLYRHGAAGAVSLHLGVISNSPPLPPPPSQTPPVQSPFIWESSPTDCQQHRRSGQVQSPFIWESSPTDCQQHRRSGQVQSPFIWESSPTGTS